MGKYVKRGTKRQYDNDEKLRILNSYDTVCGKEAVKCARLHDVPQSTISTWVKQRAIGTLLSAGGTGSKTALPAWIERDLADVIVFMSEFGNSMDRSAVQDLFQSLCKHMKCDVPQFTEIDPVWTGVGGLKKDMNIDWLNVKEWDFPTLQPVV